LSYYNKPFVILEESRRINPAYNLPRTNEH